VLGSASAETKGRKGFDFRICMKIIVGVHLVLSDDPQRGETADDFFYWFRHAGGYMC
jgi:hypothetical protein